jgi:hypothetical protein
MKLSQWIKFLCKYTSWLKKQANEGKDIKVIGNPPCPPLQKGGNSLEILEKGGNNLETSEKGSCEEKALAKGGNEKEVEIEGSEGRKEIEIEKEKETDKISGTTGISGGYAKACNQGISESSGEYIAILTDDVVVPKEWLSGMLECLYVSSDTGIVGPMTTNVTGPQNVIKTAYTSPENLDGFASAFREKYRHRRVPARKISGCCMVFRHDLTDRVGLFDEQFDVQDTAAEDFCLRAAMEGYGAVIAGDVFLYHHGGENASAQKRDEIARAARDVFAAKLKQADTETLTELSILNAINTAGELISDGPNGERGATLIEARQTECS